MIAAGRDRGAGLDDRCADATAARRARRLPALRRASSAAACATQLLGRPVDDLDLAVDKPPETVMRALEAAQDQGRPDRLEAWHGDGDRQRPAVRDHDPAARRRDRRAPRGRGLHRRLAGGRRAAATSPSTRSTPIPTARCTIRSTAAPISRRAGCASSAIPTQRIAEDRLRVLRFFRFHAWYGRPPLDGPSYQACARNAGRARRPVGRAGAQGAAAHARGGGTRPMRSRRCAKPACSITGCPSTPAPRGCARLIAREDEPDGLRRLAAILPTGADATAIGKRLKLSTQEAHAPRRHAARASPAIDIAGGPRAWRGGHLPAGQRPLHRPPAARDRCAGRLACRAAPSRAPGRRPSCR